MFKPKTPTQKPEDFAHAYDYAVFLLSLKLRTVGEVLSKMKARGYSERIMDEVLERLKENKYLDDQRYAEIFLENLKTYRSFGFYGIKKKFMEKKVPPKIIESVLRQGLSVSEETKIAERLLKKEGFEIKKSSAPEEELQYRAFDEDSSKQKAKLANRLKSRGFRGEVIARLIF